MDTFTLSTNELANGGLGSGRGRAAGATLLLTNQGNTKIRLLRGDRGRRRCITVETVSAVRVFFGRCAMVLFRFAVCAAFLMFRLAAARCFAVARFLADFGPSRSEPGDIDGSDAACGGDRALRNGFVPGEKLDADDTRQIHFKSFSGCLRFRTITRKRPVGK